MSNEATSNEKIQEALQLLNEAAKEKKEEMRHLLTDKYADLCQTMTETSCSVEQKLSAALDRAVAAKAAGTERAKEMAAAIDQRVHDEPWKTVGWMAAAAFVVGYLLGRKD